MKHLLLPVCLLCLGILAGCQYFLIPGGTVEYLSGYATGGAVPSDGKTYHQGATVTVLGNTGSLADTETSFNGYSLYGPFAGWNTKLDGTGTSYLGGDTFVMGTSNVALYAIFPKLTYTVTYDANGASSGSVPIDSTRYAPDELVTVFGNTGNLAKNGFAFVGWNTDPSGNGVFYSGGSYFGMGPSNLVLYADWQ